MIFKCLVVNKYWQFFDTRWQSQMKLGTKPHVRNPQSHRANNNNNHFVVHCSQHQLLTPYSPLLNLYHHTLPDIWIGPALIVVSKTRARQYIHYLWVKTSANSFSFFKINIGQKICNTLKLFPEPRKHETNVYAERWT